MRVYNVNGAISGLPGSFQNLVDKAAASATSTATSTATVVPNDPTSPYRTTPSPDPYVSANQDRAGSVTSVPFWTKKTFWLPATIGAVLGVAFLWKSRKG